MRDRHLWEGAFAANGNETVRTEVAMEPEVAVMAITDPEAAAEPGMGSVRQSKYCCEQGSRYRHIAEGRSKGYLSRRLLIIRVTLFRKKINPFCQRTRACPGCLYRWS